MRIATVLFLTLAACADRPLADSANDSTSVDLGSVPDPTVAACVPAQQPIALLDSPQTREPIRWSTKSCIQIVIDPSAAFYTSEIMTAFALYENLACGGLCFTGPTTGTLQDAKRSIVFLMRDRSPTGTPGSWAQVFFDLGTSEIGEAAIFVPELTEPLGEYLRICIAKALGLDVNLSDAVPPADVTTSLCHVYGDAAPCSP